MVWYTPTRRYYYNSTPTEHGIEYIAKDKVKHLFLIMDIDYVAHQITSEFNNVIDYFAKNNKYGKLHFVIVRPQSISKKLTKQYKDKLWAICQSLNIPKSKFYISTETDFHIKYNKETGIIYRITAIPNTLKSDYVYCYDMNDKQPLLRIAGTINDSIVDGIGMRYVIFTQGCPHHCKGCHNPETWDYNKGHFVTVKSLYEEIIQNPILQGVTFSGGEPFMQAKSLMYLIGLLKYYYEKNNKRFDVTVYTGFKLNDLQNLRNLLESKRYKTTYKTGYMYGLLSQINYIIDGRFEEDHKSLECKFRGSTNQKMYERIGPTNDDFVEIYPYKKKNK